MAVTVTEKLAGAMKKVKFAWVSAADGTFSGLAPGIYNGKVVQLVTVPGATAPTDLYDITVTDEDGVDVLAGAGANRATATTQYVAEASLGAVAQSQLTINGSNAGASKEGTAYLFIR